MGQGAAAYDRCPQLSTKPVKHAALKKCCRFPKASEMCWQSRTQDKATCIISSFIFLLLLYCKEATIIYEETRIGFSVPACSPSREIKYGKPGGGSRKFQIITSSSMTHLREICENWWRLGVHPRQIMQNFIHTPIHKRESIAKCCWGSSSLQAGHLEITCLH